MTNWILWNIRGISDRGSFARLKALIRSYRCPLVAILEPFVDADQIGSYALRLGFSFYACNSNSKIWVFWHSSVNLHVLSSSEQALHGMVNSFTGDPVYCSFIYAKCNYVERRALWSD